MTKQTSRLLIFASLLHLLLLGKAWAYNPPQALVVVFGRPGSGKTTIANQALALLEQKADDSSCCHCLGIDLDVCIPQWMKDNFAQGIYPSLQQRQDVAEVFCDHVEEQCKQEPKTKAALVSFSFVNTDLRDIFRARFPTAAWVLVDTSEQEANVRINQREGHFYGGKPEEEEGEETVQGESDKDEEENSEWNFAPVDFPHDILDGNNSVESNAQSVSEIVQRAVARKLKEKAASQDSS